MNSRTWMTLVIFQALYSLQSQWPWQPQWHHFTFFTEFYVSMNTGTKMTNVSWSLNVEWIIKNTLIDFWHPFSWRLWRPSYETKIKFKGKISKPSECTFFARPLKKPFCPRTPSRTWLSKDVYRNGRNTWCWLFSLRCQL